MHSGRRPSSIFSCLTDSFTSEIIMSGQKRKATSAAAAAKGPSAKQQKLAPVKEEKKEKERPAGWLQDFMRQQRTDNKEMKFNKKRLRFISDSRSIKPGSEGVLYWMSRDHRVQGEHAKTTTDNAMRFFFLVFIIPGSLLATCFVCFPSVFKITGH